MLLTRDDGVLSSKTEHMQKVIKHFDMSAGKDVWFVGDSEREIEEALTLNCTAIGYGHETDGARVARDTHREPGAVGAIGEGDMGSIQISRDQVAEATTYAQLKQLYDKSRGEPKLGKV